MALKDKKPEWKATIEFVPFTSDFEREFSYRTWAKLVIRAKENELKSRANKTEKGENHESNVRTERKGR